MGPHLAASSRQGLIDVYCLYYALGRLRLSLYTLGVLTLLSSAIVAVEAPLDAANAATAPAYTFSMYEHNVGNDTLEDQGYAEGQTGTSGTVILDFGRPAYQSSTGDYGTIDFDGNFVSNSQILSAMEHYAVGWVSGSTSSNQFIDIARGTSNNQNAGSCSGCGYRVPDETSAGTSWASRVNDLSSWINSNYPGSGMFAVGAIDAEPAYDSGYTATRDFVDSYNSSTTELFVDYGSAEPGIWTDSQLFHISFNGDDVPFPEIYGCCHAGEVQDWLTVDDWGTVNKGGYFVDGVTSDYHPNTSCNGSYKPSDSWNAMLSGINNDGNATPQSTIPRLTKLECGTA